MRLRAVPLRRTPVTGSFACGVRRPEKEKANARADEAFLVVKRKGNGVGKVGSWFVVHNEAAMLTRFLLGEYVVFLKALGYTADGMKSKNSALQANGGLDERFTTGSILDQIGAN